MMRHSGGTTKAEILQYFASLGLGTRTPLSVVLSVGQWRRDPVAALRQIQDSLKEVSLFAVRSSRRSEDQAGASQAGAYLSVLGVSTTGLAGSINDVIASYSDANDDDQVLVQEMVTEVVCSGVLFTHDPTTSAPYIRVNFSLGADTTSVTSGRRAETWIGIPGMTVLPPAIAELLLLLADIERAFGTDPIDVEWAITSSGSVRQVWLLQARPIVLSTPTKRPITPDQLKGILEPIRQKVAGLMQPHPFLLGESTILGVMPDWNPAEIIGTRPRPLSLSLYREMVTDSIWAYQRDSYGYRNLRSFPLVVDLHGVPYVDARVSFNSFVPKSLDDSIAQKLVHHYLERLRAEPQLHDRIEFEIVMSTYSFDIDRRLATLASAGLNGISQDHILRSLRDLTRKIIDTSGGHCLRDINRIATLGETRSRANSISDDLTAIYWLLEYGRRYGTLPFAGLARAAFIAVQMLQSLVAINAMSVDEYEAFISSLKTVNRELIDDFAALPKEHFLERYGHLRPGTYDITTPSYADAPDNYFDWSVATARTPEADSWELSSESRRAVASALTASGLDTTVTEFFRFCRMSIEWRERSKFEFSHNLSLALGRLQRLGESIGLGVEDLSFASASTLKHLFLSTDNPRDVLRRDIAQGQDRYQLTTVLELPPLISSVDDLYGFTYPDLRPTFITRGRVRGRITTSLQQQSLHGAVALIRSADPGFDWIFAAGVAGFVTAWGGANSHMSIRAGELGVPAAVGVGDLRFQELANAREVLIDCGSGRVEAIA
jgi:phosphohistidine swiveling domain-containing protein